MQCPEAKRVASKSAKTRIFQFVYFMPGESNFFTLSASNLRPSKLPHSIRCTSRAEDGALPDRYLH